MKGIALALVCILTTTIASATPYKRTDYKVWEDEDHNCLDTREEVLKASAKVLLWRTKCDIKSGVWVDEYNGTILKDMTRIDIDHVVPLKYANDHGLKDSLKPTFGNDQTHLLVTSSSLNRSKGSKSIYYWHPPMPYLCKYAQIWSTIGHKYNLTYDKKDQDFIFTTLTTCNENSK